MIFTNRLLSGSHMGSCVLLWVAAAVMTVAVPAEAGRPRSRSRGPSPQQIQKMKEEMAYRQKEFMRVQAERAAKEKELMQQFDENGDGRLLGPERSKYDKHLYEIRSGRVPNPFASITPLGQGPRETATKN